MRPFSFPDDINSSTRGGVGGGGTYGIDGSTSSHHSVLLPRYEGVPQPASKVGRGKHDQVRCRSKAAQIRQLRVEHLHETQLFQFTVHSRISDHARVPAVMVTCRISSLIGWNSHTKSSGRRPLRQSLRGNPRLYGWSLKGLYIHLKGCIL
jgi:hypothetical protein